MTDFFHSLDECACPIYINTEPKSKFRCGEVDELKSLSEEASDDSIANPWDVDDVNGMLHPL